MISFEDWQQSKNQEKIKQGRMFELMNQKEYKIIKEYIFIYLEIIEGLKKEIKKEYKRKKIRKNVINDISQTIKRERAKISALVRLFNDKEFKKNNYYFSDFIKYDFDITSILERIPEETQALY